MLLLFVLVYVRAMHNLHCSITVASSTTKIAGATDRLHEDNSPVAEALCLARREDAAFSGYLEVAAILGPWATELGEALEGFAKILLEDLSVISILLEDFAKAGVPHHHHVGNQHHLVAILAFNRLPDCFIVALNNELSQQALFGRIQQGPITAANLAKHSIFCTVQGACSHFGYDDFCVLCAALAGSCGLQPSKSWHCVQPSPFAFHGLSVQVTLALEQSLATRANDGNPTSSLSLTTNSSAKDFNCNQVDGLTTDKASLNGRGDICLLAAIHPIGDASVCSWRIILRIRSFSFLLFVFIWHDLREVDVLSLSRCWADLLGYTFTIGQDGVITNQDPLVTKQVCSILIAEESWVLNPCTTISRTFLMTTTVDMTTANQSHRLTIAEAHATKNISNMFCILLPIIDSSLLVDLHAL
mmetsp:Transcript_2089/g.4134  ORF Transcript_2089/g.4134 Transcript_2089/m.4134 type:complete len:416 (+) Transcript_2089:151-1398(+)